MSTAAGITSILRVSAHLARQARRTGNGRVRRALPLASEASLSPKETWLRLVWTLDAGLPAPRVNQAVRDLDDTLVGVADLVDPAAGMAGEYDGAAHRGRARHRRDVARHEHDLSLDQRLDERDLITQARRRQIPLLQTQLDQFHPGGSGGAGFPDARQRPLRNHRGAAMNYTLVVRPNSCNGCDS